jgi:hypothetical protein
MSMETTARMGRRISALAVFLCAALIASVGFAERADSKRFSQKVIKSVSKKRLAGAYKGVTEQGTPVSFRLTRRGKIVDFVVPVTLSCETDVGDLDGDGTYTYYGGEITESIKSTTLRSAPLRGRKQSPQYPFGTVFEYQSPFIPDDQPPPGTQVREYSIKTEFKEELFSGRGANIYWPVPKRAAAMRGEVFMGTRNGPFDSHAPGRERCVLSDDGRIVTHVNALDFDAKKTGR